MALWQWLLDGAGALLLLVLLYLVALVVRRRILSRGGGTFELSHRVHDPERRGGGWVMGLGRYTDDSLEWFRVFSLSPRPRGRWSRERLSFDGRRVPMGSELHSLYPDHLVICCDSEQGQVDLAMSEASLTGFQSWLEARRPGADWSR